MLRASYLLGMFALATLEYVFKTPDDILALMANLVQLSLFYWTVFAIPMAVLGIIVMPLIIILLSFRHTQKIRRRRRLRRFKGSFRSSSFDDLPRYARFKHLVIELLLTVVPCVHLKSMNELAVVNAIHTGIRKLVRSKQLR